MNESHDGVLYSRKQSAPVSAILFGSALLMVIVGIWSQNSTALAITLATAVPIVVMGCCFHYLQVEGTDDGLWIRFGPVPLFRKYIHYADITKVEAARSTFLDGWGIHKSLRGGWIWNIWGFDCVGIYHSNTVTWVGTTEPTELVEFLQSQISNQPNPSTVQPLAKS